MDNNNFPQNNNGYNNQPYNNNNINYDSGYQNTQYPQTPYQNNQPYNNGYQSNGYNNSYGAPTPYGYYPQPVSVSGDSNTAGLILGIASIVLSGTLILNLVCAIIGLILSSKSRKRAKMAGLTPSGNANAGFICSIIGLVIGIIVLIFCVLAVALGIWAESLDDDYRYRSYDDYDDYGYYDYYDDYGDYGAYGDYA